MQKNSFKIFKKAQTYIVPTLSIPYKKDSWFQFAGQNYNITNSLDYHKNLEKMNEDELKQFQSFALAKLEMHVEPNFERFLRIIKQLRKHQLLYVRVKNKNYSYLKKLVEQKDFHNFFLTIENDDLNEEQLLELYDKVNLPIFIGINFQNLENFSEPEIEGKLKHFFKQMFQFYHQIKVIEMNIDHLPDLLSSYKQYDKIIQKIGNKFDFKLTENENQNDTNTYQSLNFQKKIIEKVKVQKTPVSLQTLIDFSLLSEFRGFLDINIQKHNFHQTLQEEQYIKKTLQLVIDILKENDFELIEVESVDKLFQIINKVNQDDFNLGIVQIINNLKIIRKIYIVFTIFFIQIIQFLSVLQL